MINMWSVNILPKPNVSSGGITLGVCVLVILISITASHHSKIELNDFEYEKVKNGNFIQNTHKTTESTVLLTKDNKLVSIANLSDNLIKPKKVF